VAEVGADRLLISVGAGTLTDIAKVTAKRTGSRHVAVQTACSINGFIADRSVLIIAGAKRTVVSRWPDMLVADSDILTAAPSKLNIAGVGDLSTVPNAVAMAMARLSRTRLRSRGRRTGRRDACTSSLARAARDAEPAGLIWPGWRRCLSMESSARRRPHRAVSMRCLTYWRWRSNSSRGLLPRTACK
jgi:glycerol-1-phosphate dehydrogenase [NAD(P)+]